MFDIEGSILKGVSEKGGRRVSVNVLFYRLEAGLCLRVLSKQVDEATLVFDSRSSADDRIAQDQGVRPGRLLAQFRLRRNRFRPFSFEL